MAKDAEWTNLDELNWPVYANGYQWIKARDRWLDDNPRVVPMLAPATAKLAAQWYAPRRDKPALFRTFADTPVSQEGILRFAQRYGMLGGSASVLADTSKEPPGPSFEEIAAEPLAAWMERIFSMRQAIALWEMASARDVANLREVIVCDADGIQFRPMANWLLPDWKDVSVSDAPGGRTPPLFEGEHIEAADPFTIATDRRAIERFRRFADIAVVEVALVAMEIITNRFLREAVPSRLTVDLESGRPYLIQEPDSLGSALWLQFADAITTGMRFRICKECSEWFALPIRGSRISREFCSNACRVKAYRERQEKAWQMHTEGRSDREIAKTFDTALKTVRGWIIKKGK